MTTVQSNIGLAERARAVIPGGVNSSNRVLPWPLVVTEAAGAYFTDAGYSYREWWIIPISPSSALYTRFRVD